LHDSAKFDQNEVTVGSRNPGDRYLGFGVDDVVDVSLEIIDPDDLVFDLDSSIFECLGNYDIAIDDVELDLGNYSFFVELILSN
jgi:hypothetical protein